MLEKAKRVSGGACGVALDLRCHALTGHGGFGLKVGLIRWYSMISIQWHPLQCSLIRMLLISDRAVKI